MAPTYDLLERRKDKFMLWFPAHPPNAREPHLVLGTLDDGPPKSVYEESITPFVPSDQPDLWELDPKNISLPLLVRDQRYLSRRPRCHQSHRSSCLHRMVRFHEEQR